MKKRLTALCLIMLALALILPNTALAYTWSHVGGDPLIPGGVWNEGRFGELVLNSAKVGKALRLVTSADKLPSWVLPAARDAVSAGDIYTATIGRGTKVGAMSYGRKYVRVVKNTTYKGQYKHLPYYYVLASHTTVSGCTKTTISYRVCMAKPCGNVYVFAKSVKNEQIPPPPCFNLYVEKRQDSLIGTRLAGWEICGTANNKNVDVRTSSDCATLVGSLPCGAKYDLAELLQSGWQIVSPAGGRYSGTMPDHDVTLTYVNSACTPPTPNHELSICATVTPVEHLSQDCYSALLVTTVLTHSDGDALTYTWYVNGQTFTTPLASYPIVLSYNTVYLATVIATDAAGHQAQYTLPPFNEPGPSAPPPIQ